MGSSDASKDREASGNDEKKLKAMDYMDLDDLFGEAGTSTNDDLFGEAGTSTKVEKANGDTHMDNDVDTDDDVDPTTIHDLGAEFLKNVCRKVSMSFFEQHGLISHQINSYNEFIKNGVQNVFDSIGEITVHPGYDPSKKGDNEWRFASVKFGKVTLERPRFWTGDKFTADSGKEFLDLLPRHARLQNMTYSSRVKVQIHVQVNNATGFLC